MANINSVLTYNANLSPAQAQIKALTGQIGTLTAAFNTLDKSAVRAQGALASTFLANVGQIGGFTTQMVQSGTAVDNFGKALSKQRLTMRQYFREAIAGYTKQNSMMKQLAAQQVRMQQSMMVPMGAGAGGGARAAVLTPTSMNALSSATALASQKFSIFNELIRGGSERLLNFGKNTQWTGRQLMVGFTLPLAMFTALVSKQFREIDKELTRFEKVYGGDLVNTVEGSTQKMREQVKQLAYEISAAYGIAASDTAALAADIAQTGKEGEDLISSVKQTTRLAVLGEVERQEAMRATLSIQNAFKLSTDELSESIDFLNAVENQTSTTLQDLAGAIPRVGPVIQALGGDIKDMSLLLVAMREGGVSAAEAANALKSGLGRLINPTKQAREVAASFGVSLEDIIQSSRGQLIPMIFGLQDALQGLDDFARAQVIEKVFGKYQFARMSALFANLRRQGSQTLSVMELASASSTELAGIANKELRALQESSAMRFQRTIENLKNSLIPLGEMLTESLIPILSTIGGGIKSFMEFFQALPEPVKNFTKYAIALTALAGPVVMLVGLFGNLIANGIKFSMGIVRIGAKVAGLKFEKFELLTADVIAARQGVDSLTTSFTTQEAALRRLTSAMSTYSANISHLMRTNPQLFAAGAIPKATSVIRRQKGSDRPEVVPGGFGGGDRIPAMLEPGEFVVRKEAAKKYAPVLMQMNRGNLQGFQEGTRVYAHVTAPRRNVPIEQVMGYATPGSQRLLQAEMAAGRSTTTLFNNLVLQFTKTANDMLNAGKMTGAALAQQFKDVQSWNFIMDKTGLKMTELQPVIDALESRFSKLGNELIDDPKMYAIVEQELRKLGASGDYAAQVLSTLSDQFATFEYRRTDSPRPGRAAFGATTYGVQSYKGGKLGRFPQARDFYNIDTGELIPGMKTGIDRSTRSSSPSREAEAVGVRAGVNIGNGAIRGLQQGMSRVASPTVNPFTAAMQREAARPRIFTPQRSISVADFDRQMAQISSQAGASSPIGGPRSSLASARQQAQSSPGMGGMGMMNAMFAISMLTSSFSMLGGQSNDLAIKLGMLTSAVMVASTTMQMFSGKNVMGNFLGLGGLGKKAMVRGRAMNVAAGGSSMMGSSLMRLGGALGMAGGPVGIIGAGVVAGGIAGFIAYQKAAEEARARAIAAFADPTKTAEYFGVTIQDTVERMRSLNEQIEDAEEIDKGLREAVKTDYASLIEKVKYGGAVAGARELSLAFNKMLAMGIDGEKAKEAIKAIAVEAGVSGGAAYATALKKGMLEEKTAEEIAKEIPSMFGQESNRQAIQMAKNTLEEIEKNAVSPFERNIAELVDNEIGDALSLIASATMNLFNPLTWFGQDFSGEGVIERAYDKDELRRQIKQNADASRAIEQQQIMIQEMMNISGNQVVELSKVLFETFKQAPEESIKAFNDVIEIAKQSTEKFDAGPIKDFISEIDPLGGIMLNALIGDDREIALSVMKAISSGISAAEITDILSTGGISELEVLIKSKVDQQSLQIALDEMKSKLTEESVMKIDIEIEGAEENLDSVNSKLERMDKVRERHEGVLKKEMNRLNRASQRSIDAMENEIDLIEERAEARREEFDETINSLEEEKDQINESTDAYINSIQKRQRADSFYSNQRKSAFSALQKLASGDVFGFLQEREQMSQDAQQFAYDEQIKGIEETRDREIDAIDLTIDAERKKQEEYEKNVNDRIELINDQIDAEQDLMSQRQKDFDREMRFFDRRQEKRKEDLEDQKIALQEEITQLRTMRENANNGIILSATEVSKRLGEEYAKPYIEEQKQIIKTQYMREVFQQDMTPQQAEENLRTRFFQLMDFLVAGTPGGGSRYMTTDEILKLLGFSGSGSPASENRAMGGYIKGPGTQTSDSIPARLSNGEYVVRASSVSKYGKGMMDAINEARFAEGGFVGRATPEFLSGMQLPTPTPPQGDSSSGGSGTYYPPGTSGTPRFDESVLSRLGISLTTAQNVLGYLNSGGWPKDLHRLAWTIAMRESGGNPKLYHDDKNNPSMYSPGNGDYGLFQINKRAYGTRSWFNIASLLDGNYNSRMAYQHVSNGGSTFLPWALLKTYNGTSAGFDWSSYNGRPSWGSSTERNTNAIWPGFLGYSGGTTPYSGGGTGSGLDAVRYAVSQSGKPYSMNASPPASWDCSKLTAWSWAVATGADPNKGYRDPNAKVSLTPYSHTQAQEISKRVSSSGPGASISGLIPGDILYFSGTSGQSGGHTSIYAGDGRVFEASSPSAGLRYADLNNSWNRQHFKWGGPPKGFATGGFVTGPGGSMADKIPAMLSNGEYVVRANAVDKYGKGMLDQINAGQFGMGGMVGMYAGGGMLSSPMYNIPTSNSMIGGSNISSMRNNENFNSNSNVKIVINGAGNNSQAIANKVIKMINRAQNNRNHSRSTV